jgi:hypothetical protein
LDSEEQFSPNKKFRRVLSELPKEYGVDDTNNSLDAYLNGKNCTEQRLMTLVHELSKVVNFVIDAHEELSAKGFTDKAIAELSLEQPSVRNMWLRIVWRNVQLKHLRTFGLKVAQKLETKDYLFNNIHEDLSHQLPIKTAENLNKFLQPLRDGKVAEGELQMALNTMQKLAKFFLLTDDIRVSNMSLFLLYSFSPSKLRCILQKRHCGNCFPNKLMAWG